MNGTAPRYLGSELQRVAGIESRRRLQSALHRHRRCMFHGRCTGPLAIAPSPLPRKDLECAAAGDHVAAVAGGIQACTETDLFHRRQIIRQCKLSATAALTLQL